MTKRLRLTHNELVFLVSDLVVEAQNELKNIHEQTMYDEQDQTPGPLQLLQAVLSGGKIKSAPVGSTMSKQADEYYRRQNISKLLNSQYNKDIVTDEFLKVIKRETSQQAKNNPKSLWSIARKLYPKNKQGEPTDTWISQQITLELYKRQQVTNKKIGFETIMGYTPTEPTEAMEKITNTRNNILKSGGYLGLSPDKMLTKLFQSKMSVVDVDAVFSTLVEGDVDLRAILSDAEDFIKWQNTNKLQKSFFKKRPELTANIGIPSGLSDDMQDLIDLYQAPFKNSEEGNKFRGWMKELYPNWRGTGNEKLDRKGSHRNTYINQAWRDYGVQYKDATKNHELESYQEWLEKNRLKDNSQMKSYYKKYLKGESYKHGDVKGGENINPTAPIYTLTEPIGSRYEAQDWDSDGTFSCMDCHVHIGNGYTMGYRPNEAQEMFMGSLGFSYPAYAASMDKALEVVNNWEDYVTEVPVVKWFLDDGYHLIVDICSFVAYLVCPLTYGVGCAASVGFDILNAYAYVNWDAKKDYYSAGLQLAFAIVPGGEFIKILAKRLRPTLDPFFKMCMTGAPSKKAIIDMLATVSTKQKKLFKEIIGPYAKHFPSQKAVDTMETILNSWLRQIKPYMMGTGLYNTVKVIKDWAIRNFRWWVFLVEQVFYDPAQSLFTLLGDLSNKFVPWLGLKSYTDYLKDWPKLGVSFYNWFLERYDIGGMEAIVQTSIDNCTNKVYNTRYSEIYNWVDVKKNWIESKTSSADPYISDREYWVAKDGDKTRINKAKREQDSGFKTKEKGNLRIYKSPVKRMEGYHYTPINGEWYRRLKDSDDEWVNMTPKGDLWDEDKFRDDWFGKGWRPKSDTDPDDVELTQEEIMTLNSTIYATMTYNKFKTCKKLTDVPEFKKYFDNCKLFIGMWVEPVEEGDDNNKVRTAMDEIWYSECK